MDADQVKYRCADCHGTSAWPGGDPGTRKPWNACRTLGCTGGAEPIPGQYVAPQPVPQETMRTPRRAPITGGDKFVPEVGTKRNTGIGGAPTRPRTMPTDAQGRKQTPLASGFFDYFPDAIVAIAQVSYAGNEQHNPGKPLHWDRSKSTDEADTLLRHFAERGTRDTDGVRHSAKMAWRALALLQKEIEAGE